MKPFILLFTSIGFSLICNHCSAQNKNDTNSPCRFIGVSGGLGFPMGSFKSQTFNPYPNGYALLGQDINIFAAMPSGISRLLITLNAGYNTNNLDLKAFVMNTSDGIPSPVSSTPYKCFKLLAGVSYIFPTPKEFSFGLNMQLGAIYFSTPTVIWTKQSRGTYIISSGSVFAPAIEPGVSIYYSLSHKTMLFLSENYIYSAFNLNANEQYGWTYIVSQINESIHYLLVETSLGIAYTFKKSNH